MVETLARVVRESDRVAPACDLQVVVQTLRCALHGIVSLHVLRRNLGRVAWETLVTHLVAGVVRGGSEVVAVAAEKRDDRPVSAGSRGVSIRTTIASMPCNGQS